MACFIRPVARFGVISALGLGATYIVLESVAPGSARAVLQQGKQTVTRVIAQNVDDPVAIRAQLRQLEEEYPQRIAQVRTDLTELRSQRSSFEHELEVARRVVELTEADMGQLRGLISRAEEAQSDAAYGVVRVRFDRRSLDVDQAYEKAARLSDLRNAHAARAHEIERDLTLLAEQENQLASLLDQLETEREQFRQQLWQLDRQVDAIARNDRMIEMMEKRQATLDEISPYAAASLDQVTARLAEVRSEQEQQLQALGRSKAGTDYVARAKNQLDAERGFDAEAPRGFLELTPPTIEIAPEDEDRIDDSVASKL
ncbi:MAG: hypothetical protein AAF108_09370 [Planctomycetota bacterium]